MSIIAKGIKLVFAAVGLVFGLMIAVAILREVGPGITRGIVKAASNEPSLESISLRTESPLFGDPILYGTFRNTGGAGRTLVIITQNDHTWKRVAYFDKGEQRELRFTLPGMDDGKYHLEWKPADAATPAELADALTE